MVHIIIGGSVVSGQGNEHLLGVGQRRSPGMAWSFKEDMDNSRNLKTGQIIIMGRKTWDTIPLSHKPLLDRWTIVISSKAEKMAQDAPQIYTKPAEGGITGIPAAYDYIRFAPDLQKAIAVSKQLQQQSLRDRAVPRQVFVIGGAQVFNEMIRDFPEEIEKMCLTKVMHGFTCDYFINIGEYLKRPHTIEYDSMLCSAINIMPPYIGMNLSYQYIIYNFKVTPLRLNVETQNLVVQIGNLIIEEIIEGKAESSSTTSTTNIEEKKDK